MAANASSEHPWLGIFLLFAHLCQVCCQDLKVTRCSGEGMDVTMAGPFTGILTVKSTTCQIQVRLTDSSPMLFFVPYGEKCAIKVDRLGRAMFSLVIAEQKANFSKKPYYDMKEVTLLCTYFINIDLDMYPNNRLDIAGKPGVGEVIPRQRSLYPQMYQSPVLSINE